MKYESHFPGPGAVPIPVPPQVRRGIAPHLLMGQVRNTVPFVFDADFVPARNEPHLALLRNADPEATYTTDEYFALALAAHHGTVATFVPTDVDVHIRFKLWAPTETLDTILAMTNTVVASKRWSNHTVSTRSIVSCGESMSGHDGEWFSTAAAAYGALKRRAPEHADRILSMIVDEMKREAAIYSELRDGGDGIATLKAATIIAHNLGDLDRVIDVWELKDDDRLRVEAYKAGHDGRWAVLAEAGAVNKALMAVENHRHFTLRKPKCLRRTADLLLPIAPFLYEWGARVARHPALDPREIGEITEALVDGWERLQDSPVGAPVGYSRALAGIEEHLAGGLTNLSSLVPARIAKKLRTGALRTQIAVSEDRFLGHWSRSARKLTGN